MTKSVSHRKFEVFKASLASEFRRSRPEGHNRRNLQAGASAARCLGGLVQQIGSIADHCTRAAATTARRGDMVAVSRSSRDVAKTMVFKLARWRNAHDLYGTGKPT
jgi:NAD+ synthase (glutamine-hydrolysing)